MIVRCAWCLAEIRRDAAGPAVVSHGVCPPCAARVDVEIQALEVRLGADHAARGTLEGRCMHGELPGAWCTACEAET